MQKYMVTFDLRNAAERDYERVYKWAHENGGYRYFRGTNGVWGRLPSASDGERGRGGGLLRRLPRDPRRDPSAQGEVHGARSGRGPGGEGLVGRTGSQTPGSRRPR